MEQRRRHYDETELTHQIRVYADKIRLAGSPRSTEIAAILSAHAPYINAHLQEEGYLQKIRDEFVSVAESAYHRAKERRDLPGRTEASYDAREPELKWSEPCDPQEVADLLRNHILRCV